MKKLTKDIRFISAVFVLLFVVLGWLAINAIGGNKSTVYGESPAEEYATGFYFKAPLLQLDADSSPNTSFLVINNQAAVVSSKVYGTAVQVDLYPFTIKVLSPGQSQIHLNARMRSGEIKTITCTVSVQGDGNQNNNHGGGQGYSSEPVTGTLSYEFETKSTLAFSLLIGGGRTFMFGLTAEVLEGDIKVSILGNVARITKLSSFATSYKIRFSAKVDGEVVAVEDIQNSL